MPLVSIIIPVRDRADVLRKSLRTLLAQTMKDLEVFVVSDDCPEDVAGVVTEFRGQLNINYEKQVHAGGPVARNRGFDRSTGKYVIFWDADLMAEPTMIERLIQAIEKSNADFAYPDYKFGKHLMQARKFDAQALRERNYIHSSVLIRRESLLRLEIRWDTTIKKFQDWDLWLMFTEKGAVGVHVPEVLYALEDTGVISRWMPSFSYKWPFKFLPMWRERVKKYEEARRVIAKKHGLVLR